MSQPTDNELDWSRVSTGFAYSLLEQREVREYRRGIGKIYRDYMDYSYEIMFGVVAVSLLSNFAVNLFFTDEWLWSSLASLCLGIGILLVSRRRSSRMQRHKEEFNRSLGELHKLSWPYYGLIQKQPLLAPVLPTKCIEYWREHPNEAIQLLLMLHLVPPESASARAD